MYESPLFLAAHDEDGGGRSVPTTPLQVAAPGTTLLTCTQPSVFMTPPVFKHVLDWLRQSLSLQSLCPQTVLRTLHPSRFLWSVPPPG